MSKIISQDFFDKYYTIEIDNYVKDGKFVEVLDAKDNKWIEVDNINGHNKAKSLFN